MKRSSEVSVHEARLFVALQQMGKKWMTSKELAKEARISERTARAHTLKLVSLGVLSVARVFPGHRYQLAKASKRSAGYVTRLRGAVEVFDLR